MENTKTYVGRIVIVKQATNVSMVFKEYDNVHDFEQIGADLIDCFERHNLYVNHNIIQTPKGETLFIRID